MEADGIPCWLEVGEKEIGESTVIEHADTPLLIFITLTLPHNKHTELQLWP